MRKNRKIKASGKSKSPKRAKRTKVLLWALLLTAAAAVCGWIALQLLRPQPLCQQPAERTIGSIQTPRGYTRVTCEEGSMGAWLRELPLREPGTPIMLYTGGKAKYQNLGFAVIDLPLLSNAEQCADVCMRLRGEYLYSRGKYLSIHFESLTRTEMRYLGGASRTAFERYMKKVFDCCNTRSLYRSLEQRPLTEVQPGDILVYPARKGRQYGHAVMVVDVAKNKKGETMIMCAEGNTPARDMHIVRNASGAWTKLHPKGDNRVGPFRFEPDNLKKW